MKATVVEIVPEPVKPSIKLTLELTPQEIVVLYTLGNWNRQMAKALTDRSAGRFTYDEAADVFLGLYRALAPHI